jgi:hypothetical protein
MSASNIRAALDATTDTYPIVSGADLLAACEAAAPGDIAAGLLPLAREAAANARQMQVRRDMLAAIVNGTPAEALAPATSEQASV